MIVRWRSTFVSLMLLMLTTRAWAGAAAPDARDQALLEICGEGHETLHGTARHLAERALDGQRPWTMVELARHLRTWGIPQTGARAWTLRRDDVDRGVAKARLQRWLNSLERTVRRRCGVASVRDSTRGEAVVVVAVPVYADARIDVPNHVRQGSWVTVDAVMHAQAHEAKIVLLGPRGAPRTIPSSFDRVKRRVVGRFMADRTGAWLVQVVATTATGPRPVLESQVLVGVPSDANVLIPGLSAGLGLPDAESVFSKLNDARRVEGLRELARDPLLDRVADAHVREMMHRNVVAHDVGDGAPPERAAEAGEQSSEIGENVSKAANAALVHRALWESPSHRANMLHARYDRVGVAARRDARGRVWVTQVFAGR